MAVKAPKPIYNRFYVSPEQLPELMTRQEVAIWFRVTETTVDNWVRTGRLRASKIGNITRFHKSEIIKI